VKSYPLAETEYKRGYYVRVWGRDFKVYKRLTEHTSALVATCPEPEQAYEVAKALSK
jgi:hypothetical protein